MTKKDLLERILDLKESINEFKNAKEKFLSTADSYKKLIDDITEHLQQNLKNTTDLNEYHSYSSQKIETYLADLKNFENQGEQSLATVIRKRPQYDKLIKVSTGIKINNKSPKGKVPSSTITSEIEYWTQTKEEVEKKSLLLKQIDETKKTLKDFKSHSIKGQKPKILPKTSFACKAICSRKMDIKKYNDKIKEKEKEIESLSDEIQIEKKLEDYIENTLERFKRVHNFCTNYTTEMEKILKLNLNYKNLDSYKHELKQMKLEIKKLERKEIFDSLKLAQMAFEKFYASAEENIKDLKEQDKIKATHTTIPNSVFDKGEYHLKTPFGQVKVNVTSLKDIMISTNTFKNPTYDLIVGELDKYFQNVTSDQRETNIKSIVDPMIKYLKQRVKFNEISKQNQELLNEIKGDPPSTFLNNNTESKELAAALCGILMLSESHQFRNPTLNKIEYNALKNVRHLAEKGYNKPFGKVFANKTGRYIPAHSAESDGGDKSEKKVNGGMKQARMLLTYKLIGENKDIAIAFREFPEDLKKYIKEKCQKFFIDKDGQSTSYINSAYIKIKDLPKEKYKFGKTTQPIREFFKKQVTRNLRKIYKSQNQADTNSTL